MANSKRQPAKVIGSAGNGKSINPGTISSSINWNLSSDSLTSSDHILSLVGSANLQGNGNNLLWNNLDARSNSGNTSLSAGGASSSTLYGGSGDNILKGQAGARVPFSTATALVNSTSIDVDSPSGFSVGQYLGGTGIATGTQITAISGSTLTISKGTIASLSGSGIYSLPIACSTAGTAGNKSTTLTVTSTSQFYVGQIIQGDGIATGTTVKSISGNTITLSAKTVAPVSGNVYGLDSATPPAGFTPNADFFKGGTGNTTIIGGNVAATLIGGTKNNSLIADGSANNPLHGPDSIIGAAQSLWGGNNDGSSLYGNTLLGGTGTDTLRSGTGYNTLISGSTAAAALSIPTLTLSQPAPTLNLPTIKLASNAKRGAKKIKLTSTAGLQVGQLITGKGLIDGTTITKISGKVVTLSQKTTAAIRRSSILNAILPSGSQTLNLTSTDGLVLGQIIAGDGLSEGTTITGISGNTITLSSSTASSLSDGAGFSITNPSGSQTLGLSSTAGLQVGQMITGNGIAVGTSITGISGNTITLSARTTTSLPSGSTISVISQVLIGQGITNSLVAGTGNDSLLVVGGNSTMIGGSGQTSLTASTSVSSSYWLQSGSTGAGNTLQGGAGFNTLVAGAGGNDSIIGGSDHNLILLTSANISTFSTDTISLSTPQVYVSQNTLGVSLNPGDFVNDSIFGGMKTQGVRNLGLIKNITNNATEIILGANAQSIGVQSLSSGAGRDTLSAQNYTSAIVLDASSALGSTSLYGGTQGNDTFFGSRQGNDTMVGGSGNDLFSLQSSNFGSLSGGDGTDTIQSGGTLTGSFVNVQNAECLSLTGNNIVGSLQGSGINSIVDNGLNPGTITFSSNNYATVQKLIGTNSSTITLNLTGATPTMGFSTGQVISGNGIAIGTTITAVEANPVSKTLTLTLSTPTTGQISAGSTINGWLENITFDGSKGSGQLDNVKNLDRVINNLQGWIYGAYSIVDPQTGQTIILDPNGFIDDNYGKPNELALDLQQIDSILKDPTVQIAYTGDLLTGLGKNELLIGASTSNLSYPAPETTKFTDTVHSAYYNYHTSAQHSLFNSLTGTGDYATFSVNFNRVINNTLISGANSSNTLVGGSGNNLYKIINQAGLSGDLLPHIYISLPGSATSDNGTLQSGSTIQFAGNSVTLNDSSFTNVGTGAAQVIRTADGQNLIEIDANSSQVGIQSIIGGKGSDTFVTGFHPTGYPNYSILSSGAASGATVLQFNSVSSLLIGSLLTGTGVAPETYITAIDTVTRSVTLSTGITQNLASGTSISYYGQLVNGSIGNAGDYTLGLTDVTGLGIGYVLVGTGIQSSTYITGINTQHHFVSLSNSLTSSISDATLCSIPMAPYGLNVYFDASSNGDRSSLSSGSGNDTLLGGSGSSTLIGGDGNNSLIGGNGYNSIKSGVGNSTLDSGFGISTLQADGGTNLFVVRNRNTWIQNPDSLNPATASNLEVGIVNTYVNFDPIQSTEINQFDPYSPDNSPSITKSPSFASSNLSSFYNLQYFNLLGTANYGVGNALDNTISAVADNALILGMGGNNTLVAKGAGSSLYGDSKSDYASPDLYAYAPTDTRNQAFIDGVMGVAGNNSLIADGSKLEVGTPGNFFLDGGPGYDDGHFDGSGSNTLIGLGSPKGASNNGGYDTLVQRHLADVISLQGSSNTVITTVDIYQAPNNVSDLIVNVTPQLANSGQVSFAGQRMTAGYAAISGATGGYTDTNSLFAGSAPTIEITDSDRLQVAYGISNGTIYGTDNVPDANLSLSIVGGINDDPKNSGKYTTSLTWTPPSINGQPVGQTMGYLVNYQLVATDTNGNTISQTPFLTYLNGTSQDLTTTWDHPQLTVDNLPSEFTDPYTGIQYVSNYPTDPYSGYYIDPSTKNQVPVSFSFNFKVTAQETVLPAVTDTDPNSITYNQLIARPVTLIGGSGNDMIYGGLLDDTNSTISQTRPVLNNNPNPLIDTLPGLIHIPSPYGLGNSPEAVTSGLFPVYENGGLSGDDLLIAPLINDGSGNPFTAYEYINGTATPVNFKSGLNTLVGGQGSDTFVVINGGTTIDTLNGVVTTGAYDNIIKYGKETPAGKSNLVVSLVKYLSLSDTNVNQGKFIEQAQIAGDSQFLAGNRLDNTLGGYGTQSTLMGGGGRDSIYNEQGHAAQDVLIGGTAYGLDSIAGAIHDFAPVSSGGNGYTSSIYRDTDPVPVGVNGPGTADNSQYWMVNGGYDALRNSDTLVTNQVSGNQATLDGGAGNDSMVGSSLGDDFFIVSNGFTDFGNDIQQKDVVVGNGGNDTIMFTGSDTFWSGQTGSTTTGLTYQLSNQGDGGGGQSISNLILQAGDPIARNASGNYTSTGNQHNSNLGSELGSNLIVGNNTVSGYTLSGNNVLDGGGVGGAANGSGVGVDSLIGNGGDDTFNVAGYYTGSSKDTMAGGIVSRVDISSGIETDLLTNIVRGISNYATDADWARINVSTNEAQGDNYKISLGAGTFLLGAAPSYFASGNLQGNAWDPNDFGIYKYTQGGNSAPNLVAEVIGANLAQPGSSDYYTIPALANGTTTSLTVDGGTGVNHLGSGTEKIEHIYTGKGINSDWYGYSGQDANGNVIYGGDISNSALVAQANKDVHNFLGVGAMYNISSFSAHLI
jgi:RTX calcium-binding nonapeptide repeat (4 copies)